MLSTIPCIASELMIPQPNFTEVAKEMGMPTSGAAFVIPNSFGCEKLTYA